MASRHTSNMVDSVLTVGLSQNRGKPEMGSLVLTFVQNQKQVPSKEDPPTRLVCQLEAADLVSTWSWTPSSATEVHGMANCF